MITESDKTMTMTDITQMEDDQTVLTEEKDTIEDDKADKALQRPASIENNTGGGTLAISPTIATTFVGSATAAATATTTASPGLNDVLPPPSKEISDASAEDISVKKDDSSLFAGVGGTIRTKLGPWDVLLGRGTGANANLGNVNFRKLVQNRIAQEIKLKTWTTDSQCRKRQLAIEIVAKVKAEGGVFLRRVSREQYKEMYNTSSCATSPLRFYLEVPETTAISKTKESFRHQLRSFTKTSPPATKVALQKGILRSNLPFDLRSGSLEGTNIDRTKKKKSRSRYNFRMEQERIATFPSRPEQYDVPILAGILFANGSMWPSTLPPCFPRITLDGRYYPGLLGANDTQSSLAALLASSLEDRESLHAYVSRASRNLVQRAVLCGRLQGILEEEHYDPIRFLMLQRAVLLSRNMSFDQVTSSSPREGAPIAAGGLEYNSNKVE